MNAPFSSNRQSQVIYCSLVTAYMEDIGHRLKPTTIENMRNIIDTKLLPYFSKLKVREIDTITVRKWQNELISYHDEDGEPYSDTYLKSVHNQLSAILNYAVKHYGLTINPCKVAGSIGKSKADKMKIWTQDQFEQFSGAIVKSAMKLAFDVLFFTGMRSGELLALTPAHILPTKRIRINKTYTKMAGEELFLTSNTSKGNRTLSIPDFLYDEIQEYVKSIYGIQNTDRIFYFTRSALDKEIKRAAAAAGLEPIRVHDLRHSHASMLIDMGFDIMEISRRLGHESIKTTIDTYGHLYPEKDMKLAGALKELRRPSYDS